MILGSVCTRNCGFCSVESAVPELPSEDEPERVARAARDMGLRYVVITSVSRDDLPDGGAQQFAETVKAVRSFLPGAKIEVLTPDFGGDKAALRSVLDSAPDVFNHNVETAPRLYPLVRAQADYGRSLLVLKYAKEMAPHITTKSGFMVGLGETYQEVISVMEDLRSSECDYLTIGQYLRPSKRNIPVVEYVIPETFERYRETALSMGFKAVASGPLVRSSMGAEDMFLRSSNDRESGEAHR